MRILSMVLVLAGASFLPALAQDPPSSLKMTLTLDRDSLVLGDDLTAEVRLENAGAATEVAEFLLEERSLAFEITLPGGQKFIYAVTLGNPHIAQRLPLPRVPLPSGASLVQRVRIPVVQVGSSKILAVYRGSAAPVRSNEAGFEVKGSESGDRLAAILELKGAAVEGTLQIDLDPALAPLGVTHFVSLARRGFYNDMVFHRVIKANWVHTGCPYGDGEGGPGFSVRSEHPDQKDVKFEFGTAGFSAYQKSDAIGSQFFLVVSSTPLKLLEGKFPAFGKIAPESADLLKKLGKVKTQPANDRPEPDVKLVKLSIALVKSK